MKYALLHSSFIITLLSLAGCNSFQETASVKNEFPAEDHTVPLTSPARLETILLPEDSYYSVRGSRVALTLEKSHVAVFFTGDLNDSSNPIWNVIDNSKAVLPTDTGSIKFVFASRMLLHPEEKLRAAAAANILPLISNAYQANGAIMLLSGTFSVYAKDEAGLAAIKQRLTENGLYVVKQDGKQLKVALTNQSSYTDELEASHAVESWAEVKWVEPDFLRTIKLFPAIGVRN